MDHYVNRESSLIDARLESGREQYGTGQPGSLFKGRPLIHAKEEAGDLMHYINWAERELEAHQTLLAEATDLLDRLSAHLPQGGPITTAMDIKRDMMVEVLEFRLKMNAMEQSEAESIYQWMGGASR